MLADGTTETKSISSAVGNVINVSSPFSSAPQLETVYSIQASNVKHQKFRCLAIGEGENGTYSITGVQHVDNIYNVVETENALLEFADVTLFDEAPPVPVDLTLSAADVTKDDLTTTRITASWSRGSAFTAIFFKVKYRLAVAILLRQQLPIQTLLLTRKAWSEFRAFVRAVGPAPRSKESADATVGLAVPASPLTPPDPTDVTLEVVGKDQVSLRWAIGQTGINKESLRAVIRHTTDDLTTAAWANTSVMRTVLANSTFVILPRINGTYFIKLRQFLAFVVLTLLEPA